MDNGADGSGAASSSSDVRQRLFVADEVYLYKVPTLKKAGGHRAEDWNLSEPLKTCRLVVEQRGDALALEFFTTTENNNQLFCQSIVDLAKQPDLKLEKNWLEQVVDSSRYFVVKIQGPDANREALIGFGFRDRDKATDLRESVQHYERTMKREQGEAAKKLGGYHVPKMAEGEKIHVNRAGKSTITKESKGKSGGGSGAIPLLKKPPSSPQQQSESAKPAAAASASASKKDSSAVVDKLTINLDGVDLDADHRAAHHGHSALSTDQDEDESSGGAVYAGDEDQWKTEFNTT